MIERSQAELTLSRLPGVISARVFGDGAKIDEVHILSDGTRHPKQVARDVETCLAATFATEIDHRRISVAQIEPVEPDEARLLVDTVLLKLQGRELECEVVLRLGERAFTGRARGPASARQRLLLVARAAAEAVAEAAGRRFHLIVEDIGRYDVGGEPALACLVLLSDERGVEPLVGSAYVRRDEAEAAVRATLASLNRRIGLYLDSDPTASGNFSHISP